MAAGFKQATVNASDVPSTQSDFPSYVDLSRVGITTLAEAQSVRVYSDSGKTTELAREIVSVTEMHVKIPSLTSSFTIYVDYDGVRSDYAVGDTYGRNAVWSDYDAVYHLQEAVNNTSGGYKDSTGNGNDATGNSMALTEVAGAFGGNGQDFDGSADYIDAPRSTSLNNPTTTNALTLSVWIRKDSASDSSQAYPISYGVNEWNIILGFTTNLFETYWNTINIRNNLGATSSTDWNYFVGSFDGTANTFLGYINNTQTTNITETGNLAVRTGQGLGIGAYPSGANYFNGKIDELRIRSAALSANWVTTEYNNQSDEATFWGTWTDAGGGGGYRYVPQLTPFAGL